MIPDIDKDVSASKLISFADDTGLYSGVGDVTDSFSYVSFSSNGAAYKSNVYIDPSINIIRIIYDWIFFAGLVPSISDPFTCSLSLIIGE